MKDRLLTDAEHEVVEGLIVDVHQGDLHGKSKIRQVCQMLPALAVREFFLLLNTNKEKKKVSIITTTGTTPSIMTL